MSDEEEVALPQKRPAEDNGDEKPSKKAGS